MILATSSSGTLNVYIQECRPVWVFDCRRCGKRCNVSRFFPDSLFGFGLLDIRLSARLERRRARERRRADRESRAIELVDRKSRAIAVRLVSYGTIEQIEARRIRQDDEESME